MPTVKSGDGVKGSSNGSLIDDAQDVDSNFSFTRRAIAPWNDFLLGSMTALALALLVAVFVSCTGMPAAAIAYQAGGSEPSMVLTAHVPAYCPSSPRFRDLPWDHPIKFFAALAAFAYYTLSLHDAGLFSGARTG